MATILGYVGEHHGELRGREPRAEMRWRDRSKSPVAGKR